MLYKIAVSIINEGKSKILLNFIHKYAKTSETQKKAKNKQTQNFPQENLLTLNPRLHHLIPKKYFSNPETKHNQICNFSRNRSQNGLLRHLQKYKPNPRQKLLQQTKSYSISSPSKLTLTKETLSFIPRNSKKFRQIRPHNSPRRSQLTLRPSFFSRLKQSENSLKNQPKRQQTIQKIFFLNNIQPPKSFSKIP